MKFFVQLVTYNGAKYIPYLFQSLREQTSREWELLIIDNHSSDDTVALMQKELVNFPVASRVIVNSENVGFARGHNQAFRETSSEYFLILNQDLYLAPDCLKQLWQFIQQHPKAAAVAPRLMRWNFSAVIPSPNLVGGAEESLGNLDKIFTNVIDSGGLKVFRNRRVVEIGQGEEWRAVSPQKISEVFGVSGACALFRRYAVNDALLNGQLFDETYVMYKEDVDLAFRLRSRGYAAYVVTDAVAYHDRTAAGQKDASDLAAAQNKKTQSALVRYHSYKNHLMTLFKNEYGQNFILDLPWIVWYELKKLGYFLLFDREVLGGFKEIWRGRKNLKLQRLKITELRKDNWREIRKWWL
ncbi:MAG: glycosyltransferase [Candidatus Magasanikbacteria bacterium]|nr:glycosyltransferase [Candidatus Magasanikbacteria bacterium]